MAGYRCRKCGTDCEIMPEPPADLPFAKEGMCPGCRERQDTGAADRRPAGRVAMTRTAIPSRAAAAPIIRPCARTGYARVGA